MINQGDVAIVVMRLNRRIEILATLKSLREQIDSHRFSIEISNSPQEWLPCRNIIVARERGQKIGLLRKGCDYSAHFSAIFIPQLPAYSRRPATGKDGNRCIAEYKYISVNKSLSFVRHDNTRRTL